MSQTRADRTSSPSKGVATAFHISGTAWFLLCVGFVLIASLRQAGFKWWVIFSLSGQSMVILLALASLYLFAIRRGAGRAERIKAEHPLTSNDHYMTFYMSAPFLGGLAGCINGMVDAAGVAQFVYGVTLGTFGTTFVIWVIVDPLCGLLETFTPASRKNRVERLARQRAEREERKHNRDALLLALEKQEQENHCEWNTLLFPYADELAALLSVDEAGLERAQHRAAELGLFAWQTGGIGCMRYLHDMTLSFAGKQDSIDYIAWWWDGIGTWRNDPVVGQL